MLQILVVKARVLRDGWARALMVLLGSAVGGAAALSHLAPAPAPANRVPAAAPSAAPVKKSAAEDEGAAADADCRAQLSAVSALPARRIPAVDEPALRAQLLGRTKAVPVLFVSVPAVAVTDPVAVKLRQQLEALPGHQVFGNVVGKVRDNPAQARAVFLREGYLYTENPELAALFGALTLSLLFRDPELRISRGAEELLARRLDDGDYEYTSGPEQGRRAKLLLFDRVVVATSALGESPSHHVDVRGLAKQLGFDELSVERITERGVAAQAVYGDVRAPTLLRMEQGKLSLVCEVLGAGRGLVQAHRAEAERAQRVQSRLLGIVKEQVDEALPFDEPKTEDGQQDGHLRPEWRHAYLRGNSSYEFNGDRYAVFDSSGRPRPPQVCIDFVLDTFERASGTWWQGRDLPRQRVLGRLRFEETAIENRRSVERFIEFARAHGEAFDVYEPAPERRVPLRNRQQFFSTLYQMRQQFKRGDVVAILGPRDDEKLHYHSFIIVDADPLSGMPTELAANAGRPRIRSWEGEMGNAPRRSIFARVRPRQLWLESFLSPLTGVSADAPAGVRPGVDAVSPAPEPTAG
jgi:hypothetical protein